MDDAPSPYDEDVRKRASVAATGWVLAILMGCVGLSASADAPPPNVLVVITDDEAYGSDDGHPRLSEWFEDGAIFHHAIVTTPVCCPSRASFMSGKYASTHGVKTNFRGPGNFDHSETLQAELKARGYSNVIAGKFLNGWNKRKIPPHFDAAKIGKNYDERYFRFAQDFIRQQVGPWFAMVTPRAPHAPWDVERPYASREFAWDGTPATGEQDRSDKPKYVRRGGADYEDGLRRRTKQLRTLLSVDDWFMQTLDLLEDRGELDNTIVIYTSDNGYMWAEHGLMGKFLPYRGSLRIPLMMRGPGVPTTQDTTLRANIDLAPTLFSLLGIEPTYAPDGRSLFGPARDELRIEAFGNKQHTLPPWTGTYSLERSYVRYSGGQEECYDLESDPYQLQNEC